MESPKGLSQCIYPHQMSVDNSIHDPVSILDPAVTSSLSSQVLWDNKPRVALHLWWPLKEPCVFTYNILQVLIGWKAKFSFLQSENRFCLHKRVNWRTGKNFKTLWERPFPGDTRWLQEGTESLTPAEYPWDNDHNRTWLQCRGLIQDYTAGTVRKITKENLTKHQCKHSKLMTWYRSDHALARQITEHNNHF